MSTPGLESEPLSLIEVFGKIAKLIGNLPDDPTRIRVLAAVFCLLDDGSAKTVLALWKGREGAIR